MTEPQIARSEPVRVRVREKAIPTGWSRLCRGALEALAIISCFAASGLGWAAIESRLGSVEQRPEERDDARAAIYADAVTDVPSTRSASPPASSAPALPSVWLIDGFNVLHAGLLGGRDRSKWWTESKRQELLDRVERFDDTDAELWIVFDGHEDPLDSASDSRPRCIFAPSADDWLVDRVRQAPDPTQMAVVTADRQVAGRARSRGAIVVSPRDFLARCTS